MDYFNEYMADAQERATETNFASALSNKSREELIHGLYVMTKECYEAKKLLRRYDELSDILSQFMERWEKNYHA